MYSLKLLIWEMPALSKNTSLKKFRLDSIDQLRLYLDMNTYQTLIFGHWLVQCSSYLQTTFFSSQSEFKAFLRIRITFTRLFRCWDRPLKSLQRRERKVQKFSTRRVNFCTETLNSNSRSALC